VINDVIYDEALKLLLKERRRNRPEKHSMKFLPEEKYDEALEEEKKLS
jgi:hypothetical protein